MVDRFSSIPPASLSGMVIQSEIQQGVTYRLERQIGEGGSGMAYLALRQAPDGLSPVVIKLVRTAATSGRVTAEILVQKEAVALGRLNERVPPTPFVVRFIDTGTTTLFDNLPMPWLAIEYVHGGIEGTTLEDRTIYSIHSTGYAFDPNRAMHAVRCLTAGLGAIHAVGVIHRDITPGNVLCCGFGEAEIFKISDFGVARPHGLAATFGGLGVGTAGYAAPEQSVPDSTSLGPYTDTFGLACVIYYVLTGEHYFEANSPVQAYSMAREKRRRSINESSSLCPDFLERPEACRAIDAALARATSFAAEQRPQTAHEFGASIIPWLGDPASAPRPSRRLVNSVLNLSPPGELSTWSWTIRHPPGDEVVIQSAAWDADGRCFAFTPRGPLFWNGLSWLEAPEVSRALPEGMSFARRYEAGGWLVGGATGTLAVYNTDGVREIVRSPDPHVHFSHASGRFDDLLAAVGHRSGEPPTLWGMAARRWLKPLRLDGVSYVAALLRLDDARWVVCGRLSQGQGFSAIYSPLQWELTFLKTPATRAFVGGASEPERGLALLVGADGVSVRVEGDTAKGSVAAKSPDLTAAAMDVLAREWVASLGKLWVRDPERGEEFRPVWTNTDWQTPFVSLMADAGMLTAMTVDGGIVEGRAAWHALRGRH
ncbi:MAG TPA: serine/threonine-protein kinase [Polyangiaceae bacterium]|nr:serine/threonine-protein kinase [Polyangiaceae bacterium]